MIIGLIDVDGKMANFALMRISSYHKDRGDEVEWADTFSHYDRIYQAKIFSFTPEDQTIYYADEIVKGGTGYDVRSRLPEEIEKHYRVDYSIYKKGIFMKEKIDRIKKMLVKAEKIAENLNSPLNLAFSGGKDSVVLKFFADEAGIDYVANFCNTGIEIYTDMPHFIRDNYPDVNIIHPKRDKSFFPLMKKHGYPTLFRRWCCEYLKHNNDAMKYYKVNLTGVRGEESRKRLERGAIIVFGNTKRAEKRKYLLREIMEKDTEIQCIGGREKVNINAIFDLTDDEVWDIIRSEKLILPPIYETHKRTGCAFCPFASPRENYAMIKKRPNLAKAWLKTIKSPQFKDINKNLIHLDEVEQFYLYINRKMLRKEEIKKVERYLREPDLFGVTGKNKFIEYLKRCKVIE